MAIDKKYSIWLSTVPQTDQGQVQDQNFMYVGSSASVPLNISYNSTVVGILGEMPDTAIFTDGVGGAVLKINISAVRPNMPQVLGLQPGTQETPNTYSNKAFIDKLTEMRSKIQMQQNQYILRIYNLSTLSAKDLDESVSTIENLRNIAPRDICVFIESFEASINIEQPNQIDVSISMVQRNLKVGYND